ncbi:hypothetical protein CEXT_97441 [Caerostris extrusa]|uniref:Uncharacterized protein n=1 Tax=Caerostris extrusa TaxID=172846 RepID=A0AAV4XYX2_CAEEX|nr:hypothetical protein CEXT_97441 [Caerostris extrusa]
MNPDFLNLPANESHSSVPEFRWHRMRLTRFQSAATSSRPSLSFTRQSISPDKPIMTCVTTHQRLMTNRLALWSQPLGICDPDARFRSLGDEEIVEFECRSSDKGLEATAVMGPEGELQRITQTAHVQEEVQENQIPDPRNISFSQFPDVSPSFERRGRGRAGSVLFSFSCLFSILEVIGKSDGQKSPYLLFFLLWIALFRGWRRGRRDDRTSEKDTLIVLLGFWMVHLLLCISLVYCPVQYPDPSTRLHLLCLVRDVAVGPVLMLHNALEANNQLLALDFDIEFILDYRM